MGPDSLAVRQFVLLPHRKLVEHDSPAIASLVVCYTVLGTVIIDSYPQEPNGVKPSPLGVDSLERRLLAFQESRLHVISHYIPIPTHLIVALLWSPCFL